MENALYLPLRRPLMRLLASLLAREVRQMQLSLQLLQQAKPSLLGVRFPDVQKTKAWGRYSTLQYSMCLHSCKLGM
ncbi:hypothetical protein EON64_21400 [archaeon]|nr:MAG: hypothetical protein EON64_21400 [archaeon]